MDMLTHRYDVHISRYHGSALVGHTQEICGLPWSTNKQIFRQGLTATPYMYLNNHNTIKKWITPTNTTGRSIVKTRHTLAAHIAAVKAISKLMA